MVSGNVNDCFILGHLTKTNFALGSSSSSSASVSFQTNLNLGVSNPLTSINSTESSG